MVLLERAQAGTVDGLSGLQGLSRTLQQEWPDVDISTVSMGSNTSAIHVVSAVGGGVGDVRLSGESVDVQIVGGRPRLVPQTAVSGHVWLVSGGARGVTAACIIELARRQPGSVFVLAGRSGREPWPDDLPHAADLKSLRAALIAAARERGEKPALPEIDRQARKLLAGQEISETLAVIERVGGVAHYLPLDVGDAGAVSSAVAQIVSRHGPVTGLVHGAGVLADSLAEKKTRDEVARVFQPKVSGLINLLGALDMNALRHVGLFSSAAAVFGNVGQSDYAMANGWLNAVAWQLYRTLPEVQVKSFCWGPWEGGMVDATLAAHFAEKGIGLIGLEDGARIFADQMLQGARDEVQLLIGDEWSA